MTADLVHRFRNLLADLRLVAGDGGDELDLLLVLHRNGRLLDLFDHGRHGLIDAALDGDRVATRGHVAQALVQNGLSQNGRGGGAVTGHVVGLAGHLFAELGTHVLVGIVEFDFLRDGDAVLGDRGASPLLVEDDVAALGAEGHLHRVGDFVDTALQGAASVFIKY